VKERYWTAIKDCELHLGEMDEGEATNHSAAHQWGMQLGALTSNINKMVREGVEMTEGEQALMEAEGGAGLVEDDDDEEEEEEVRGLTGCGGLVARW
jgi:hypothetical protein